MQQLFFSELLIQTCDVVVEMLAERAQGRGAKQQGCSLSALLHDCTRIAEQQESMQMVTAATNTLYKAKAVKARTKRNGVVVAVCSFLHMSLIGFVRFLPSLKVNCAILLVLMLPSALFPVGEHQKTSPVGH